MNQANQREQLQKLQASLCGDASPQHADRLLAAFGSDAFRVARQCALEVAAESRARAVMGASLVPVSAAMFDRELASQIEAERLVFFGVMRLEG